MQVFAEEMWVVKPLGIRFWDLARDGPVSDGLEVSAWRAAGGTPPVEGKRTRSGVPYPTAKRLRLGSPPGGGQGPLTEQTWPVRVSASCGPGPLSFPLVGRSGVPRRWVETPQSQVRPDAARCAAVGPHQSPGETGRAQPRARLRSGVGFEYRDQRSGTGSRPFVGLPAGFLSLGERNA